MNVSKTMALFKRELTDIFRDKKTLFTMVVLPLVLYPLLIVGMTLLLTSIVKNQESKTYRVAFVNIMDEEKLKDLIKDKDKDFTYKLDIIDLEALNIGKTPEKALEDGDIDTYLTYSETAESPYQIQYRSANDDSKTAEWALEELLNAYNEKLQKKQITQLGLDENDILHPVRYDKKDHSTKEQSMGNILGDMIPMLIIVSIMLGAIYPAIDVTAGEKERGTLETLLTLPVSNFELIMSKFMAVAVIACVSAILNIISMGGAVGFMLSYMSENMGGVEKINLASFIPAILFVLLIMLFFAMFVSAFSMCVCVFAKSFKEANNYVTPFMLIFMFASLITMVPNVELNAYTAAIPVVNISLLIVQLFSFTYNYALFGIVLLSNVVYSLLAIMILGRIYNSEAVLFSEGMESLKIFARRSEMKKGQIPGIGDVILLICVELLLIFYVGTAAQLKLGFGGVAVTQAIILIVPLLYLWYLKADYKKILSLKIPKVKHILGALFMWIGSFCLMCLIGTLVMRLLPDSVSSQSETFAEFIKQPVLALVLVIALMPALGEELMFRGFIYGSLKAKCKNVTAIILTSVIFGIYHMSLAKFFTTAMLGFFLALIVSRTGSIFCSMLMHFCNNLIAVIIMKYATIVDKNIPILTKSSYQLKDILLLSAISVIGILLGLLLTKKNNKI